MSKKTCILLLNIFCFCIRPVEAQQNNPLINSGEFLKQSYELQEKSKYKEAIALLQQIPVNDTSYADALFELGNCANADSQYNAALQYAMEGLKLFPERKTKFTLLVGSIYEDMDKQAEAIVFYNQALLTDPHSSLLYFNRGIMHYRLDQVQAAIADIEKSILINPYYADAHFLRGKLYVQEGNFVPALLAYKTYLMLAPSGKYQSNVIKEVAEIAKVTDDVRELANKREKTKDAFTPIQEILLSKIALDKQYVLKAKLEDNIVRQLQVVDEQLKYIPTDKSFAMQVYVPLYENLFKHNLFEPMIFTIFSGLEIPEVADWNKKNKKQTAPFIDSATAYLNLLRSTRELDKSNRTKVNVHYLFEEGEFAGKGTLNNRAQSLYAGNWEFFYTNGILKSKGAYNAQEEKEGEWQSFYETGQLKEKLIYRNGKAQGLGQGWHTNGNLWYKANYVDDKVDGTFSTYYYNGQPREISQYKNDKKNGPEQQYSYKGYLTYATNYVDGVEDGMSTSFHSNGQPSVSVAFKGGKKEGAYKSWYDNGQIETEGNYLADKQQGVWTTWYKNGTIKEKTKYKNNEYDGEFTTYFDNGAISRKGVYIHDKPSGKIVEYDDDGKLYNESVYDNGKLRELNFFTKDGKLLAANTIQKNNSPVVFYTPEGIRSSQGSYNNAGEKEGLFTQYYASGKMLGETNYKKGLVNGVNIEYYFSGQKKKQNYFIDGKENGNTTGYYGNGQLRYDGWVIGDQSQQQIIFYNALGDITSKEYYLNDEQSGKQLYYHPSNKPSLEYNYINGWLESIKQLDTTGKIVIENIFKGGNGPLVLKYDNGAIMAQGNYTNYLLHGVYKSFFVDGTLKSIVFYKNGDLDSTMKEYYPNGQLKIEGQYKNGKFHDLWKFYNENGKPKRVENYVEGNRNGELTTYNFNGGVERVYPYKEDMLEGEYKVFGDNNQLMVSMLFKNDNIISYTYQGKDGKMVPPIPIIGTNGKVTAYYQNGNKSADFTFVNNDLHGDYTLYYSNGREYIVNKRTLGYEDGLKKIFYPDGTLQKEEQYVLGMLHGSSKTYYPNGKLSSEEWYYNDEQHGTCNYYDMQGKLKQKRVYYYGILQAIQ